MLVYRTGWFFFSPRIWRYTSLVARYRPEVYNWNDPLLFCVNAPTRNANNHVNPCTIAWYWIDLIAFICLLCVLGRTITRAWGSFKTFGWNQTILRTTFSWESVTGVQFLLFWCAGQWFRKDVFHAIAISCLINAKLGWTDRKTDPQIDKQKYHSGTFTRLVVVS